MTKDELADRKAAETRKRELIQLNKTVELKQEEDMTKLRNIMNPTRKDKKSLKKELNRQRVW